MKLSIFTTETNPVQRGDNYGEAMSCYNDLADEVIVVDGMVWLKSSKAIITPLLGEFAPKVEIIYKRWPKEFKWELIGKQFQRGYESCTGDWVIHCDLDFLFHEKDFDDIRKALERNSDAPAVSFHKWQFIQPDRYNLKSRLALAVNKKRYGDRIKFNGGGDLCQPTLDGNDLKIEALPEAGINFYNYEKLSKTEAQIRDDVGRMDRAYQRHFGKWLYSKDGTEDSAYEGWLNMVVGRAHKPSRKIKLYEHPIYIQDTIKNLRPDQFGYNGFGIFENNSYV